MTTGRCAATSNSGSCPARCRAPGCMPGMCSGNGDFGNWGGRGISELGEQVELLVSEMVTNAVRASQLMADASSIRLWLRSDKNLVLILVWDGNPRPPIRMDTTEDAESGRGLLLVEVISDSWNWYRPEGINGKIVWGQGSGRPE